jgi:hypothetical protein
MRAAIVVVLLVGCALPDEHFSKPQDMCTATGVACNGAGGAADCCTGFCDGSGLCAVDPGSCGVAAGETCATDGDCCSMSCVDLRCACISDGETCSQDADCCGGVCNGTCVPLSATCKTSGNTCAAHGDCCSGYCNNNKCSNPSFCGQAGDSCTGDAACCSNTCVKSGTALYGTCAVVPGQNMCTTYGEVCGTGASGGPLPMCGGTCCSQACVPYGPTGVQICAPPTGCHPVGEQCYQDADCCGGAGNPDAQTVMATCLKQTGATVGRCSPGSSCSAAGTVCRLATQQCNAPTTCCSGNALQFDTCVQDSLGVPRCTASVGVDCTMSHAGQPCGSSADCCGLPCVGTTGKTCAAACVPQSGKCTTTADCCAGLPCLIAAGSTVGSCGATIGCSSFGQGCQANNQCCNSGICTNGKCAAP